MVELYHKDFALSRGRNKNRFSQKSKVGKKKSQSRRMHSKQKTAFKERLSMD
jgi:hypothetical protein